jgi:hypothetical protein
MHDPELNNPAYDDRWNTACENASEAMDTVFGNLDNFIAEYLSRVIYDEEDLRELLKEAVAENVKLSEDEYERVYAMGELFEIDEYISTFNLEDIVIEHASRCYREKWERELREEY